MTKEELLTLKPGDKVKQLCGIIRNNGTKIYRDAEIIKVVEGSSDCTHTVRADVKYEDTIIYAVPPYELEKEV